MILFCKKSTQKFRYLLSVVESEEKGGGLETLMHYDME